MTFINLNFVFKGFGRRRRPVRGTVTEIRLLETSRENDCGAISLENLAQTRTQSITFHSGKTGM